MRQFRGVHALLPGLLLAAACGGPVGAPGNPVLGDTIVVTGAQAVDPAVAARAAADSLIASIAAPTTQMDSLRLGIMLLTQRIESLVQSNDSLRTVVAARFSTATVDTAASDSAVGIRERTTEAALHWGPRIVLAIAVLILTFYFVGLVANVFDRFAERNAQRRLAFKRAVPITRIVLWSISLFFIIRVVLAVDARGLITAMTAIGVAIGFAAQDILKNIFGGLVIVFDQPFQVGDKIEVAGSYGEVVSIGLRSTRIVTPDDSLVSVPNAQVVDGQVSNANSGALDCQVVIDLYLPGWIDESKARNIAYQATVSSKYVFLKKPVVVLVKDEYKDTFVTHLKVKAYVIDTRHEFAFMSEVTERARAEFRRQGLVPSWHGAHPWVNLSPRTGNGESLPAEVSARGDTA